MYLWRVSILDTKGLQIFPLCSLNSTPELNVFCVCFMYGVSVTKGMQQMNENEYEALVE